MQDLRVRGLLSIHRALIGEIDVNVRAITAEISERDIHLYVLVDGEILEDQIDEFDAGAVSQIVADFPYPESGRPLITFDFLRADTTKPLNYSGDLFYLRKEK